MHTLFHLCQKTFLQTHILTRGQLLGTPFVKKYTTRWTEQMEFTVIYYSWYPKSVCPLPEWTKANLNAH